MSSWQIETYKTIGGTPHLDGEYTVFGEVVEGLDVIDKIASVKTDYMDVPVEPVTMTIEIINNWQFTLTIYNRPLTISVVCWLKFRWRWKKK